MGKAREQNSALVARYEKLQEEIEYSHEQIARQAAISHSQLEEIERLKEAIAQSHNNHEVDAQIEEYKAQLEAKDEEIRKYVRVLNSPKEDREDKFVEEEQARFRMEEVYNQMEFKDKLVESLQDQLANARKDIDNFKRKQYSEATSLLEIEHLRSDNARLVNLLRGTKEYKDFAEYIEDSNGTVNVPAKRKGCARRCASEQNQDKFEHWVPVEAFRIAQDLKATPLTDDIVNKVLAELNRIWRERERKQVERVKGRYGVELANLRRQMAMRVPFTEVQANKHIAKLRAEIKALQRDAKLAAKVPTKERQKIEVVDEALKMAGSLQRQNADFSERNAALVRRVQELEQVMAGGEYEKHKFMEGAAWISEKIAQELDTYGEQVNSLIAEYNARTEDKDLHGEIDALFVSTTQAWLLESIDQSYEKLSEKIKGISDSAKYHSETVSGKVKAATRSIKGKKSLAKELGNKLLEEAGVK